MPKYLVEVKMYIEIDAKNEEAAEKAGYDWWPWFEPMNQNIQPYASDVVEEIIINDQGRIVSR